MRRTVKASFSLFRIGAAESLQYRLAALSGATVSVFWALIEIVVLTVFFKYGSNSQGVVNGMSLSQGVSYIWLGQFFVMLQMGIDSALVSKIVSGDIGIELCRPLDLYWHWFSRSAAGKVNAFILRGGMVVICGAAISLFGFTETGLGAPYSALNFALFLVAALGSFIFSVSFGMLLISIRIGVAWGDGPLNMIMCTAGLFSGSYLPLQLWPDFLQRFLRLQPFASYLDVPVRLYTGSVTVAEGIVSIFIQIIWIFIFVLLGKAVMKRKLKVVVVQGG